VDSKWNRIPIGGIVPLNKLDKLLKTNAKWLVLGRTLENGYSVIPKNRISKDRLYVSKEDCVVCTHRSEEGDSGLPLLAVFENKVWIVGLLIGSPKNNDGLSLYCSASNVRDAFDLRSLPEWTAEE